ncbi:hypothetical protein ACCO45_003474 [Purpureocillium lilacinum]|uniref:Uncharacterized protein n=1 Tax=Purpureocillium lilacinum TaxID=33203 RepID=A0ACC4DZZ7_PURLI
MGHAPAAAQTETPWRGADSPDFVLSVASSGHGPSRDDGSAAEKYARPSQHMPSHAMGRPANADPFAPFGGRVDRPRNRHPSGPGEYEMSGIAVSSPVEMDGRGAAPVELPAEMPAEPATPMSPARTRHAVGGAARPHSYHPYSPGCVPNSPAKDPRANLSSIRTESGRAGYVNQWDQWRALGTGGSGCGNGRASDTAGDGRS